MKLLIAVLVVFALASGALAGWRKHKKWQRGCRRAAGQGVTEEGQGNRFVWTQTGLDDDDLRITFTEGAFVPEGSTTVFKYPRDRGQRALGLVPAKIAYDFSAEEPVAVIRQGRRGRGSCIVISPIVDVDVSTYDEMIEMLFDRNTTNGNIPEEEESIELVATQTTDRSQFSQAVLDMCSQDQCGRPIQPVFYTTELAIVIEEEEDEEEEEDDLVFEPSFLLFNTRVTISGIPHPRQQRWQRRQDRRQNRRQHGQANGRGGGRRQQWRQNRRQQRRQERRGRRRQ